VQLSKTVSDRDHAVFESQQSKSQAQILEEALKETRLRSAATEAALAASEQLLAETREQLQRTQQDLSTRQVECEESRLKIKQLTEQRRKAEGTISTLQVLKQLL
jgi:hypothetical protein